MQYSCSKNNAVIICHRDEDNICNYHHGSANIIRRQGQLREFGRISFPHTLSDLQTASCRIIYRFSWSVEYPVHNSRARRACGWDGLSEADRYFRDDGRGDAAGRVLRGADRYGNVAEKASKKSIHPLHFCRWQCRTPKLRNRRQN